MGFSLNDISSIIYNYLLDQEKDCENILKYGSTCLSYLQYEHDPYALYICISKSWLESEK